MNGGGFVMVNDVDDPEAGDREEMDEEEELEEERVRVPFDTAKTTIAQRMVQNYALHTGQEAMEIASQRAAVQRANSFLNGADIPDDDGNYLMNAPAPHRGPIIASVLDDDMEDEFSNLYGPAYRSARPKVATSTASTMPPAQTPEFDQQCVHCQYSTDHDARMFQPLQTLRLFVKNACFSMDFDVIFEEAHKYYTNEVWLRAWREHGKILPRMSPALHYIHFFKHMCDVDIQLARDIRDFDTIKTSLKDQIYFAARGGQQVDPTALAAFMKMDDVHHKRMALAETRRRRSDKSR